MNWLAMLQFSVGAGLIFMVGVWILYFWLKRTGRLNKRDDE